LEEEVAESVRNAVGETQVSRGKLIDWWTPIAHVANGNETLGGVRFECFGIRVGRVTSRTYSEGEVELTRG
jgi:hypothetical protein